MATINAYYSTATDGTDYFSNTIVVTGAGSSPSNRLTMAPGDILKINYQSVTAGSAVSVTAGGFSAANWTNTTTIAIPATVGSSGSKTSNSVNTETTVTLSRFVSVRDPETQVVTEGTITATIFITIGTPPDTTPNSFTFTTVNNATPSASIGSNVVTIAGINATTNVSITSDTGHACSIRKNGSGNVSSTTVVAGNTLQVFLTAPSTTGFSRCTLTVGTYSTTFTINVDITPGDFAISPSYTNMNVNVLCVSNQITISGLGTPVTASITGGGAYFKLNDQPTSYTTATVSNGTRIKVYMTTSATYGQNVSCTLTVGALARSWTLSTTSFNPQNGNLIPLGKTVAPLGFGEVINFFGGPYTISVPSKALSAYLKGGAYVPPLTQNAGIPTAAPLALSDFLGSYHSFYIANQPAPFETFIDSFYDGGTTLTFEGYGWETLGYGNIKNACQYRYTVTTDYGSGSSVTITTSTGAPGTFSAANHQYSINVPVSGNAAAVEMKLTLTIYIYCTLNGQTLSTTKDIFITIYNSQL